MGGKVFWILIAALELAAASVEIHGQWKPNSGWVVTCEWDLRDDTLFSTRLIRNYNQYSIFRPNQHGTKYSWSTSTAEDVIRVDCSTTEDKRHGQCTTTVIPTGKGAAAEEVYECEATGEHPMFRTEIKRYDAYVPPTPAQVTRIPTAGSSPRVTLFCTAQAIPPPELVWTVDGVKNPAEFTRRKWNMTTKLWQESSTINVDSDHLAKKTFCTPVIITKDGVVVKGDAASGSAVVDVAKYLLAFTLIAALLR